MAFSGGTFSRLYSWASDQSNGIKIRADRMDGEMDGMATGLSTCLLKDGTQTATARIPFAAGIKMGGQSIQLDPANSSAITAGTNNIIIVSANGADQVKFTDGTIEPATDNDIDLGTSSKEFKNAYFDGTVTTDALAVSGAVDFDGNVQLDGTLTVGVDDTGYDVKFFGATASAHLLWDASADKLLTAGGALIDIVKDKLMIGGTAVTTTAAELNVLDGVTAGTVAASKGVVVDSNKDVASFRNVTLTGELDAGSLDVSGNSTLGDAAGDVTRNKGGFAAQGTGLPSAGAGVEVNFGVVSGEGTVQAFDRDGSAWEQLRMRGSQVAWDISGSEAMRLTSTGLGIGTTSPAYPLDVSKGGTAFKANAISNAVNYVRALGHTSGNNPVIYFEGSDTNVPGFITTKGSGNLRIGYNNGGSVVMTMDGSNGRIGIGTQSPGYTLEVDGDINFTGTLREDGSAFSAGGKVLQVVTAATSTEATSTSSTYADTNLTASITPANSSNKILVLVSQSISSTGGRAGGALRILRGTTEIEEYNQISNVENQMGQHFIQHLDSPSSTSSTTYHTEFKRIDQSGTVAAQRNDSSGNATSTITLIELDYS